MAVAELKKTGKMRKTLFILFFIGLPVILQAQVKFTANSDYSSVPAGQSFTITYSFSGATPETFTKPNFNGFRVIGQQSITGGGSFQIIINGKVVNDTGGDSKWIFTLQAVKPGEYTIGPAKVKASDGQIYTSNAVSIKVTKGGNAVANSNSKTNSGGHSKAIDNGDEPVYAFMEAIPNKNVVYVGEPVVVSYRIYTLVDITQYGVDKTESMDGFWVEDLVEPNSKAKTWEETINGKVYLVGEISKKAFYPQKSGTLTIPALNVEAVLRIPSNKRNDPFDLFNKFFNNPFGIDPFQNFGSREEKRTLSTAPINILVKPLPEEGKPESFDNAVGDFKVNIDLSKNKCLTGDGITLKITVSGQGNLMLIDAPELDVPAGIKLYEPDVNDNIYKNAFGLAGERQFEYLLVPEVQGEYTLGPWEFSWFNPETKRYETAELGALKLKVAKGSGSVAGSNVKELEQDIRYISEKIPRKPLLMQFLFSNPFWLFLAVIWLAFFIILYFMRKHIKLRNNLTEFKMKMAMRVAKKRLKKAERFSREGKESEFFQELSHAMWLFITDKFAVPISDLSVHNAKQTLISNGIDEDLANRFAEILQACDFARFAPVSDKGNMKELYNKASKLIVDVQTGVK